MSKRPRGALDLARKAGCAGDTLFSLEQAIAGMELPWTIESRTGDTSAYIKQRQRQRLPTVLVTTPESLT
jgi:ATP-dependent Lhr-like helicase